MDNLPQDPVMLMSFINTRLRDQYPTLEALCDDMDISPDQLCRRLADAGFIYLRDINQFR